MFQSKQKRPQWRIVYDHLQTMDINDIVSDEALRQLLPHTPWPSIQGAFHRAAKQMLADHLRAFDRVRTVGYRMVESREQERLALRQQRRAKRRTQVAKALVTNVDIARLTEDERRRLRVIEDHLYRQAEMMNRLNDRQLRTEQQVAKTQTRVAVNEKESGLLADRLDRLTEMLERHGIKD